MGLLIEQPHLFASSQPEFGHLAGTACPAPGPRSGLQAAPFESLSNDENRFPLPEGGSEGEAVTLRHRQYQSKGPRLGPFALVLAE